MVSQTHMEELHESNMHARMQIVHSTSRIADLCVSHNLDIMGLSDILTELNKIHQAVGIMQEYADGLCQNLIRANSVLYESIEETIENAN